MADELILLLADLRQLCVEFLKDMTGQVDLLVVLKKILSVSCTIFGHSLRTHRSVFVGFGIQPWKIWGVKRTAFRNRGCLYIRRGLCIENVCSTLSGPHRGDPGRLQQLEVSSEKSLVLWFLYRNSQFRSLVSSRKLYFRRNHEIHFTFRRIGHLRKCFQDNPWYSQTRWRLLVAGLLFPVTKTQKKCAELEIKPSCSPTWHKLQKCCEISSMKQNFHGMLQLSLI